MDYQAGYKELFNAITKSIDILINGVINNTNKETLFDCVPKAVFDVVAILQGAQQRTEEMYISSEESDEE